MIDSLAILTVLANYLSVGTNLRDGLQILIIEEKKTIMIFEFSIYLFLNYFVCISEYFNIILHMTLFRISSLCK